MSEVFAEVVLPLPLRHPFTYSVPSKFQATVRAGSRVRVPFGRRSLIGIALSIKEERPDREVREILDTLDESPLLSAPERKLLDWASSYYLTPIGEVLRHLVPPQLFRPTKKEGRKIRPLPSFESFEKPAVLNLSSEQREAVAKILGSTQPILLHGIAGSGKTEVYIEAIREILKKGGQALVLVPEIGLTPQTVGRFQQLGVPIGVYHSSLTAAQRFQVWKGSREGKFPVVIGTRSAVFLRFPNLQFLAIDEEHDSSYKQEERFCYHAREIALWRAAEGKIQVVLGSATPSLESLHRAQGKKMRIVSLKTRPAATQPPFLEMIDRRQIFGGHSIFSPRLLDGLRENLNKKEQSLLFLNRRGHAPIVLCTQCGSIPRCSHCDISLTFHREGENRILLCHYCDQKKPYDPICSQCRKETLHPEGYGTERVMSELHRLFPAARLARMDRDTAKNEGWIRLLEKMKKKEIDILVGTQMITKGHDYPDLTLVGILDADQSIHRPDFRAAERSFQLLTQVSGRSGRGERPGRVMIQTYQPDHAGLAAVMAGDGADFYARELAHRSEAGYPPWCRLIQMRLFGKNRETVRRKAELLARQLQERLPSETTLLGPSPCPIERLRDRYRWHLLLKTNSYSKIRPDLERLLDDFAKNHLPSNLKMVVNVDPMEMM